MRTYVVGGAVRDAMMGLEPKDFDYVVVGSTPQAMLDDGFSQVGADFPVFLHPTTGEEYALARTERKTGDGYHGFDVVFDRSVTLRDDLERRDLTINSMAREVGMDTIYDPFGGMEDLEKKVLRHTSSAFKDDPLRVIRLARFAARFIDFTIDPITFQFAEKMVKDGMLNHLPGERFAAEILKVLKDIKPEQAARFFYTLHSLDVGKRVRWFEGMNCNRLADVSGHVIARFPVGLRGEAFAALARGGPGFSTLVGGSEGWLHNQLLSHNRDADGPDSADLLMGLFRRIGWQNHGRLIMHCKLADCITDLGMWMKFNSMTMMNAWHALEPISRMGAELKEQGMDGKKIGETINNARHEALTAFLRG